MDSVAYCRLICNKKKKWIKKYRGVKEFHWLAHMTCYCKIMVFSYLKPYIHNSHQLAHPCAPCTPWLSMHFRCNFYLLVIGWDFLWPTWLIKAPYRFTWLQQHYQNKILIFHTTHLKSHMCHLAPCLHPLAPLVCTLIPPWTLFCVPWALFQSDWLNMSMANLTKVSHHQIAWLQQPH